MRKIFLLLLVLFVCSAAWPESAVKPKKKTVSKEEKRKRELINRLAKDFDREELNGIFYDKRLTLTFVPAEQSGPPKRKPRGNPYLAPKFGLLTEESLKRCQNFYLENRGAFDAAEAKYGVPKEIICGILRIETNYGIATSKTPYPLGRNPVINSLYSIYVRRPSAKKKEFAFTQIKYFLRIANNLGWDVFEIRGSWAGAIGLPQFIPSSYALYAVDGNGDHKINLFDPPDAIASTANFLKLHGWNNDEESQHDALFGYNNEEAYVDAVQAYAEAAKTYLEHKQKNNQ